MNAIVIANDIPFAESQLDPFVSIGNVLAFDSRDWGKNRGDAWLWGIVFGWSRDALAELAPRHRWSDKDVRRLRLLHLGYRRATVQPGGVS